MFQNGPGQGKTAMVFSSTMVFVFLFLGCIFLFTDVKIEDYPRPNRNYIGLLLGGWAIFRGVTIWMKLRNEKRDEE